MTIACADRLRHLVASSMLQTIKLGDYPPDDVRARAYERIAHVPDPGRRGDMLLNDLLVPMLPGLHADLRAIEGAFDIVVLNDLLTTCALPPFIEQRRLAVALTTQPMGGFARLLADSPCTKLVGSSPILLPPDHGLDETFVVTDFWIADRRERFVPDPVLDDYLSPAAGGGRGSNAPVVAVALGSAWGTDPMLSRQTLAAAGRRAGVRLVVQDFEAPVGTSVRSPDGQLLSIGELPYAWLFARVRAVVHHGGAGTIAEVLRARRPSVTVPHYGDHLYWANRLEATGLSAGTVLPNELDEVMLAERLDRVAHDDRLRVTVEALTSQCDAGRGVRAAADRLETLADAAISV